MHGVAGGASHQGCWDAALRTVLGRPDVDSRPAIVDAGTHGPTVGRQASRWACCGGKFDDVERVFVAPCRVPGEYLRA